MAAYFMADEKPGIPPELALYVDAKVNSRVGESQKQVLAALQRHYEELKKERTSLIDILEKAKVSLEEIVGKTAEKIVEGKKDELRKLLAETEEHVAATLEELNQKAKQITRENFAQAAADMETGIAAERERVFKAEEPAIRKRVQDTINEGAGVAVKGIKKTGLWLGAGMAGIALITSIAAISSAKSASNSASYEAKTLDYKINKEMGERAKLEKDIIDFEEINKTRYKDLGKKSDEEAAARKNELNSGLTNLEDKIGKNVDSRTKGLEVQVAEKVGAAQYYDGLGRINEAQEKLSGHIKAIETKYDDALKRIDVMLSGTSKKEDYLALRKTLEDYKRELASYGSALTGLRQSDERSETKYNDMDGKLKIVEEKLKEISEAIEKLQKTD